MSFKGRDPSGYDWSHVQESLLYKNSNIITIYAKDQYLDSSSEFDCGGGIFISEYKYKSLDTAVNNISDYSQSHPVVLVENDNSPLFLSLKDKFTKEKNKNIIFVPRINNVNYSEMDVRNSIAESLSKADAMIPQMNTVDSVSNFSLDNKNIIVNLDKKDNTQIPVLIKSSYFPAWASDEGSPVYMASPSYSLVFTKGGIHLKFTTPLYVKIGNCITIASVLLLYLYYFAIIKRHGKRIFGKNTKESEL